MHRTPATTALLLALLAAACQAQPTAPAPPPATEPAPSPFPAPARPVAGIVTSQYSDETARDREGEAETVFRLLGLTPGQTVADIGAGSGYYTIRLSPVVGPAGQVLANDIVPDYLERLKRRVAEAGLTNVTLILGDPDNARLPPASTNTALMVHMYHEIAEPYALLWHLHDSLKPGATLAIIDNDRPTANHGTPPALLQCELEAVGYQQTSFHKLPTGSYLATFTPAMRPKPEDIEPCPAG